MKKLFLYVVLGLLLSGCSDNNSIKLLEKCANKKIRVESGYTQKFVDKSLEEKLNSGNPYVKHFKKCEIELKNTPKTFKQLYK